jgi:gluconolactonase
MHALKLLLPVFLASRAFAADVEIRNAAEFRRCVPADATVQRLGTDMKFVEGPQWVPADGGYLVFSDIPANEMKKWTPGGGITSFRTPSQHANGNTLDHQGRLLTAEHSGRRVSIVEKDGSTRSLVDQFEGKRLNSPNDIVVQRDGTVWFTDPDYGLPSDPATRQRIGKEQPGNYVYRYDVKTSKLTAAVRDFDKPNGLCFSPDEKRLYVADSGAPKHIRVFEVTADGQLANGAVFATIDQGVPDGIRCDSDGRVWSSAGDGVHIFSADGELIGKILVPESPANLAFGGDDLKTLFITARTSLYSIPVNARDER